jgi:hypothetical protein
LADEIEVQINANVDDSEVQGLEDELDNIDGRDVDIGVGDEVDDLSSSLDGMASLQVGEKLGEWGEKGEEFAQSLNDLNINVGQLATKTGMAEPQMRGLIANISNATFPQEEAMAYVNVLNQMGVSSDKLGDSATNMDRINDATHMGYGNVMLLTQGLKSMGVSADRLPSAFNALAYAESNVGGGAQTLQQVLKRQAGTLNQYGMDVDATVVALGTLQKQTGLTGMKLGSEFGKRLKEANGDLGALEQSLGLQAGALSKASNETSKYNGELEKLAGQEAEHKTLMQQLSAFTEDISLQFGDLFSTLGSLGGGFASVLGLGNSLNGTLNLLGINGLGGLLPKLGGGAGLTGMLSGAGSSLMALATGPVGIAIAAIVALGVAIYEIGKYFGWWNDLPSMFGAIQSGVMALWDSFMSNEYVIQAIDLIKQGLTDAWNAIVGFGQAIMSALGGGAGEFDILGFMIQNLQMILNAVGPYIILAIQGIIQVFRNLYTIGTIVWPYITQAISTAIGIIVGVVNTGKAIFTGLMNIWNQCSSAVQSMASTISGALNAAGSAWNSFKSTVMNAVKPILDAAKQVGDAVGQIGDAIGSVGQGGIETVGGGTSGGYSGAGGYGAGGQTVTQGNTIIFNMYGDVRDEKTLDDMMNAINDRLAFDSLANNGVNPNEGVV